MFYRLTPGGKPEVLRENTGEGNGTTFDLQGRLIMCEGGNRRVTRTGADGKIEVLCDRFEGKRLNRPNDVVCRSDGSIYFTDPGLRVPLAERELPYAAIYRIDPSGAVSMLADFEYPNGLAFSPDERTLYVANTRWAQYIHALEIGADGAMVRRRIFADMSSDETDGVPDGMKVDVQGRVYCTGPGGTWVFAPDGTPARHHPHPRGPREPRLRRPRSPDAVLHRPHVGLFAPRQGAGTAPSLVSPSREVGDAPSAHDHGRAPHDLGRALPRDPGGPRRARSRAAMPSTRGSPRASRSASSTATRCSARAWRR